VTSPQYVRSPIPVFENPGDAQKKLPVIKARRPASRVVSGPAFSGTTVENNEPNTIDVPVVRQRGKSDSYHLEVLANTKVDQVTGGGLPRIDSISAALLECEFAGEDPFKAKDGEDPFVPKTKGTRPISRRYSEALALAIAANGTPSICNPKTRHSTHGEPVQQTPQKQTLSEQSIANSIVSTPGARKFLFQVDSDVQNILTNNQSGQFQKSDSGLSVDFTDNTANTSQKRITELTSAKHKMRPITYAGVLDIPEKFGGSGDHRAISNDYCKALKEQSEKHNERIAGVYQAKDTFAESKLADFCRGFDPIRNIIESDGKELQGKAHEHEEFPQQVFAIPPVDKRVSIARSTAASTVKRSQRASRISGPPKTTSRERLRQQRRGQTPLFAKQQVRPYRRNDSATMVTGSPKRVNYQKPSVLGEKTRNMRSPDAPPRPALNLALRKENVNPAKGPMTNRRDNVKSPLYVPLRKENVNQMKTPAFNRMEKVNQTKTPAFDRSDYSKSPLANRQPQALKPSKIPQVSPKEQASIPSRIPRASPKQQAPIAIKTPHASPNEQASMPSRIPLASPKGQSSIPRKVTYGSPTPGASSSAATTPSPNFGTEPKPLEDISEIGSAKNPRVGLARKLFGLGRKTSAKTSPKTPGSEGKLVTDSKKKENTPPSRIAVPSSSGPRTKTKKLLGVTDWFRSGHSTDKRGSLASGKTILKFGKSRATINIPEEVSPGYAFTDEEVELLKRRLSAHCPSDKDGFNVVGGQYYTNKPPTLDESPTRAEKEGNPIAVCMDLINTAARQTDPAKRDNLFAMSTILCDAVSKSKDAQMASEKATLASEEAHTARQMAERAKAEVFQSLIEVVKMIGGWRAAGQYLFSA
jgi:hypothetical protein